MASKKGLFQRIFKYPASSNRPKENLATEITAFFLDHYPPLLQTFLKAIDAKCKEKGRCTAFGQETAPWKVETQKRLHTDEDLGVADLVLWTDNPLAHKADDPPTRKIVVEVKIDAAPSRPGQTQHYKDHLSNLHKLHGSETAVALLTKWMPPKELAEPCDATFRFKDLKNFLRERPSSAGAEPVAYFAERWADYLEEEWCIPDITRRHIESLVGAPTVDEVNAIRKYLCDVLDSTVETLIQAQILVLSKPWRRSSMPKPPNDRGGRRQAWGCQLIRDGDAPSDYIQLGCDFGADNRRPVMRGIVYGHGRYRSLWADCQLSDDLLNPTDRSGRAATLPNILGDGIPPSNAGEPIHDDYLAGRLENDLVAAVRKLAIP